MRKLKKTSYMEEAWKRQNQTQAVHILPSGKLAIFLVVFFIAVDFFFLRGIIEYLFTDSELMVNISAIAVAVIIDVSPSVLAGILMIQRKTRIQKTGAIGITIMLLVFFALLAGLRLNASDMVYSTSSTALVSTINGKDEAVAHPAELWMSLVYCLVPVATSVLSFMIGMTQNKKLEEEYQRKISANRLYDEIASRQANVIELEAIIGSDLLGYNQKLKELELSNLEADKQITKERLRLAQALALGTPEGASNMLGNREEGED